MVAAFVAVIVLAAAGAGGWWWWQGRRATEAARGGFGAGGAASNEEPPRSGGATQPGGPAGSTTAANQRAQQGSGTVPTEGAAPPDSGSAARAAAGGEGAAVREEGIGAPPGGGGARSAAERESPPSGGSGAGPARGARSAEAKPGAPVGTGAPAAEIRLPSGEAGRPTDADLPRSRATLSGETIGVLAGGRGDVGALSRSAASVAAEARIRWVLEQLAQAFQQHDLDLARTYRSGLSADERRWLEAGAKVTVRFDDVQVAADETAGTVRCRRVVAGELASGATVREDRTVTMTLVRRPTGWIITEIR